MTSSVDQVALAPAYCAAGTAVLVFLVELVVPSRRLPVLLALVLGSAATAGAAWWVHFGRYGTRETFCASAHDCAYSFDRTAAAVAIGFAVITLAVAVLSWPVLRAGVVPAGEYCFLLACSMTGGVVLGAARDLITLIVALETLTLPLYILVGLRRRSLGSAEAAVTFFLVSVISTTATLLGAALLYAVAGTVRFGGLLSTLSAGVPARAAPLASVGAVLLVAGLTFKVAAVPFHAWAPATYDGAPLPVAAYLSTASKLAGVIAIVLVLTRPLLPLLHVVGPALAAIAVATMTIGNLAALRQRRMVRLLAWSSVAQAGYILAPLGAFALAAGRTPEAVRVAVTATLAYTLFYLTLELGAFGAVVALRGSGDGGSLDEYAGTARRRVWVSSALLLAFAGLAGLPPGLAGLFAKVAVVRSLLEGSAGWLAVVVALNAVIGLAYYVRAGAALFAPGATVLRVRRQVAVGVVIAGVTLAGLVIGFAPQLVFDLIGA